MTAREYVALLQERFGVPRPVAEEAERQCRACVGQPEAVKRQMEVVITRMLVRGAAEARAS